MTNQIGQATILNIDCMEYMATLEDNAFDLVICDPPYGIGAENHAGNVKNGWKQWEKKAWDSGTPEKEYFDELDRVSVNRIIWGANYFSEHLKGSMGWIFWDKGQRGFSLADGELAYSSFNKAVRVFELSRSAATSEEPLGRIHPTQKPIKLYEWLLTNYAKPGQTILDTHLGSGSSAIACNNLGFKMVGCELDQDYYKASIERIKHHSSQARLFA